MESTVSLQNLVRNSSVGSTAGGLKGLEDRMSGLRLDNHSAVADEEFDEALDPLAMLQRLQVDIQRQVEGTEDEKLRKKLETKSGDVKRLERMEIIYVSCVRIIIDL